MFRYFYSLWLYSWFKTSKSGFKTVVPLTQGLVFLLCWLWNLYIHSTLQLCHTQSRLPLTVPSTTLPLWCLLKLHIAWSSTASLCISKVFRTGVSLREESKMQNLSFLTECCELPVTSVSWTLAAEGSMNPLGHQCPSTVTPVLTLRCCFCFSSVT